MNRLKKKEEEKPESTPKKGVVKKPARQVARGVLNVLNGNVLSKENAVKHLSYLFFLAFILIAYTAYGYYAEKTVKELARVKKQLEEMEAEETTIKSNLGRLKTPEEVGKAAAPLGLYMDTVNLPVTIKVNKNEFETN